MIAAVSAALGPHSPASLLGERFERLRCDAPHALDRILSPLCVGASLVADRLQLRNRGTVPLHRTANPGRIYFPAGTPDPTTCGETVDLLGSVMRELAEETGLTAADVAVAPGWQAVVDASRVALMKPIDVPYPASEARTRMLRHLASEPQPELSDVRIVRSAADLDPRMPRFVTAYLAHMWSGHDRSSRR